MLKKDPESPFHGRIVSTIAPKDGQISLTNFVRKVQPHLKSDGRLSRFNPEKPCKRCSAITTAPSAKRSEHLRTADITFLPHAGVGCRAKRVP